MLDAEESYPPHAFLHACPRYDGIVDFQLYSSQMLTLADVAASGHGRVAQCKGAVMDYQIVLSSEFNINPDAFLSAWNDDVDCRDIALAERVDQPPAGFPIDPGTVLIFLGGVATTIATGCGNQLNQQAAGTEILCQREEARFEIVVIQQAPGTQLLVVKGQER